jgi:hypothetical protein
MKTIFLRRAGALLAAALLLPGWRLIVPQVYASDESVDSFATPSDPADLNPQQQQQRRGRGGRLEGMYKSQINANWFANSVKFWYRNDLSGGAKEFILVDAARGSRAQAFDHDAVAKQLGD